LTACLARWTPPASCRRNMDCKPKAGVSPQPHHGTIYTQPLTAVVLAQRSAAKGVTKTILSPEVLAKPSGRVGAPPSQFGFFARPTADNFPNQKGRPAARISLPRVFAGMGKMPAQFGPGRKAWSGGAGYISAPPDQTPRMGRNQRAAFPTKCAPALTARTPEPRTLLARSATRTPCPRAPCL